MRIAITAERTIVTRIVTVWTRLGEAVAPLPLGTVLSLALAVVVSVVVLREIGTADASPAGAQTAPSQTVSRAAVQSAARRDAASPPALSGFAIAPPEEPAVMLLGSEAEADELRGIMGQMEAVQVHLGLTPKHPRMFVVATPEEEQQVRLEIIVINATRDAEGRPPLEVIDLHAR